MLVIFENDCRCRSATHAVTDIYSQICSSLDNGEHTCVLLLDLKKAFDTVNHTLLLKKTRQIWY